MCLWTWALFAERACWKRSDKLFFIPSKHRILMDELETAQGVTVQEVIRIIEGRAKLM